MPQIDYTKIHGWFDPGDAALYRQIVPNLPNGSVVVEVGVWKGRSTACLLTEIERSGKAIYLHCVDTFTGDPMAGFGNTEREFMTNIAPLKHHIAGIHKMESVKAAKLFTGVQFCFIDAAHDYDSVMADIGAWLPAMGVGSILAGHDIPMESVRQAVQDNFGSNYKVQGNSWYVHL